MGGGGARFRLVRLRDDVARRTGPVGGIPLVERHMAIGLQVSTSRSSSAPTTGSRSRAVATRLATAPIPASIASRRAHQVSVDSATGSVSLTPGAGPAGGT